MELTPRSRQVATPMERLPQLNYSLMNDNALRKKLGGLGINAGGPRTILEKRHVEWINLVNANCDSDKPRTKRELLKDLGVWDRSQGRQIPNGLAGSRESNGVMRKDFDGVAWAATHSDDFQRLIHQARPRLVDVDKQEAKNPATVHKAFTLDHIPLDECKCIDVQSANASQGHSVRYE